jgi:hypothetical protein
MSAIVFASGRVVAGGNRMVKWHRSPSLCVETAVHYEHQAERAADPVARQKFLDLAFEWRKSAVIYESEGVGIVPSDSGGEPVNIGLVPSPSA